MLLPRLLGCVTAYFALIARLFTFAFSAVLPVPVCSAVLPTFWLPLRFWFTTTHYILLRSVWLPSWLRFFVLPLPFWLPGCTLIRSCLVYYTLRTWVTGSVVRAVLRLRRYTITDFHVVYRCYRFVDYWLRFVMRLRSDYVYRWLRSDLRLFTLLFRCCRCCSTGYVVTFTRWFVCRLFARYPFLCYTLILPLRSRFVTLIVTFTHFGCLPVFALPRIVILLRSVYVSFSFTVYRYDCVCYIFHAVCVVPFTFTRCYVHYVYAFTFVLLLVSRLPFCSFRFYRTFYAFSYWLFVLLPVVCVLRYVSLVTHVLLRFTFVCHLRCLVALHVILPCRWLRLLRISTFARVTQLRYAWFQLVNVTAPRFAARFTFHVWLRFTVYYRVWLRSHFARVCQLVGFLRLRVRTLPFDFQLVDCVATAARAHVYVTVYTFYAFGLLQLRVPHSAFTTVDSVVCVYTRYICCRFDLRCYVTLHTLHRSHPLLRTFIYVRCSHVTRLRSITLLIIPFFDLRLRSVSFTRCLFVCVTLRWLRLRLPFVTILDVLRCAHFVGWFLPRWFRLILRLHTRTFTARLRCFVYPFAVTFTVIFTHRLLRLPLPDFVLLPRSHIVRVAFAFACYSWLVPATARFGFGCSFGYAVITALRTPRWFGCTVCLCSFTGAFFTFTLRRPFYPVYGCTAFGLLLPLVLFTHTRTRLLQLFPVRFVRCTPGYVWLHCVYVGLRFAVTRLVCLRRCVLHFAFDSVGYHVCVCTSSRLLPDCRAAWFFARLRTLRSFAFTPLRLRLRVWFFVHAFCRYVTRLVRHAPPLISARTRCCRWLVTRSTFAFVDLRCRTHRLVVALPVLTYVPRCLVCVCVYYVYALDWITFYALPLRFGYTFTVTLPFAVFAHGWLLPFTVRLVGCCLILRLDYADWLRLRLIAFYCTTVDLFVMLRLVAFSFVPLRYDFAVPGLRTFCTARCRFGLPFVAIRCVTLPRITRYGLRWFAVFAALLLPFRFTLFTRCVFVPFVGYLVYSWFTVGLRSVRCFCAFCYVVYCCVWFVLPFCVVTPVLDFTNVCVCVWIRSHAFGLPVDCTRWLRSRGYALVAFTVSLRGLPHITPVTVCVRFWLVSYGYDSLRCYCARYVVYVCTFAPVTRYRCSFTPFARLLYVYVYATLRLIAPVDSLIPFTLITPGYVATDSVTFYVWLFAVVRLNVYAFCVLIVCTVARSFTRYVTLFVARCVYIYLRTLPVTHGYVLRLQLVRYAHSYVAFYVLLRLILPVRFVGCYSLPLLNVCC